MGAADDTSGAAVSRPGTGRPSSGEPGESPLAGSHEDYEADVVLRDGSTVRVRSIRARDEPCFLEFLRDLSEPSRALRFGGGMSDYFLRQVAGRLAREDKEQGLGLIAMRGPDQPIIGHAMYVVTGPDRAEVAFAIADAYQHQGLGTILLGELAQVAGSRGIRVFEATVLPRNHEMVAVFRDSGFPVEVHAAPDEILVEFPTGLTEQALDHFEQREWTAAVNAVRGFFRPHSVAVVGASRQRGTIAGEVFHNLVSYQFQGLVFPVNPAAPVVQDVVAYPSVEDIPGPVDLAVVVVPAGRIPEVVQACGRKRVRALVVLSAGFAETGPEGRAKQQALVDTARAAGMRLIGPNCMGILNTDPEVRLNATFAPAPPPQGRTAFMSQSGALGLAIMDYAGSLGMGLSSFASVGNKADISGNDLIRYWAQDPNTDVILLYLESFGNPRKFSRIARRVGRVKPIVAVKSGRSPAGSRAIGSHTGALLAAADVTVDSLFRQSGVIRTDRLEEMFDVASLLANQPPPKGRRVAILTNAGGPGILCADACVAEGLEIHSLAESTQAALRDLLPKEASVGNPVDMIASATPEHYRDAIRIVARDPNVDALVVIFIPPLVTRPEDVARALLEGVRSLGREKPVVAVFMQSRGVPEELRAADLRIPSYAFPEDAAIALARVAWYGEWLTRSLSLPARFEDVRRDEAAAIVAAALGRGDPWLGPEEVWRLLACYGLPVLDQRIVPTAEDAARAAEELGGLVALKAIAAGLVHKTEAGAVQLNLRMGEVPAAGRRMTELLQQAGRMPSAFQVQRMAPPGVEMLVGVVHDPQFGPVLACGAGGVLVELLKDVSVRLTPIAASDAEEMIRELKTYPLLTGYRGGPMHDVPALVDALLRVSAMVEELPQIAEVDLNPILVHPSGVTIVDARVRVAPAERPSLPGALFERGRRGP
ncbi:MAG TPA: GNAT family N-acetyltransferase [Gemmatimonadales bacterium]|nr:GNAT family N-acetyltransferase [Gemmatimonadales bacterium]